SLVLSCGQELRLPLSRRNLRVRLFQSDNILEMPTCRVSRSQGCQTKPGANAGEKGVYRLPPRQLSLWIPLDTGACFVRKDWQGSVLHGIACLPISQSGGILHHEPHQEQKRARQVSVGGKTH